MSKFNNNSLTAQLIRDLDSREAAINAKAVDLQMREQRLETLAHELELKQRELDSMILENASTASGNRMTKTAASYVSHLIDDEWRSATVVPQCDRVWWPTDITAQLAVYWKYVDDNLEVVELMRDRAGMRGRLSAALYKKQITLID